MNTVSNPRPMTPQEREGMIKAFRIMEAGNRLDAEAPLIYADYYGLSKSEVIECYNIVVRGSGSIEGVGD